MPESPNSTWVLPTHIPFSSLTKRELEECVYWLLDAMGAKDLEWREGGSGDGAADGGRDLEATFHMPTPDGQMEPQRWWVDCKGSARTVAPSEVKKVVNNSTSKAGLACVLIVTNSTFSNPTRDWVRDWQASHPTPRVRLWTRNELERLLAQHPSVVLRLFAEALSPEGLLHVARERFWQKLEFTHSNALMRFWQSRSTITLGALDRVALVINETVHGALAERPWAANATDDELVEALGIGMANAPYLFLRAHQLGVDQRPITAGLAHLIAVALSRIDAANLATQVVVWIRRDDQEIAVPDSVVQAVLSPILGHLLAEIQDLCAADCTRVSICSFNRVLTHDDNNVRDYWKRFTEGATIQHEQDQRTLFIQRIDAPCAVGFTVGPERGCPLVDATGDPGSIEALFVTVARVLSHRLERARAAEAATGAAGRPST